MNSSRKAGDPPRSPRDPRLAPLRLKAGYRPLPAVSEAEAIGEALCATVVHSFLTRHPFALSRGQGGYFGWRRTMSRDGSPDLFRGRSGDLLKALDASPEYSPSLPSRERAGLPLNSYGTARVGELLLRLFAQAQEADVFARFEFRPGAPSHLRYRINFGRLIDRRLLVHGGTPEQVLLAGLAFLDRLESN
jgi:hypothetical protein